MASVRAIYIAENSTVVPSTVAANYIETLFTT